MSYDFILINSNYQAKAFPAAICALWSKVEINIATQNKQEILPLYHAT